MHVRPSNTEPIVRVMNAVIVTADLKTGRATAIGTFSRGVITFLYFSVVLAALPAAAPAVTVTVSGSQNFQTLMPGHADALCFTLTISSSLPVTLQSVRFKNRSLGPGNQPRLDAELGQPRLYRDSNGDSVFQSTVDTLLEQSSASGGKWAHRSTKAFSASRSEGIPFKRTPRSSKAADAANNNFTSGSSRLRPKTTRLARALRRKRPEEDRRSSSLCSDDRERPAPRESSRR